MSKQNRSESVGSSFRTLSAHRKAALSAFFCFRFLYHIPQRIAYQHRAISAICWSAGLWLTGWLRICIVCGFFLSLIIKTQSVLCVKLPDHQHTLKFLQNLSFLQNPKPHRVPTIGIVSCISHYLSPLFIHLCVSMNVHFMQCSVFNNLMVIHWLKSFIFTQIPNHE